MNPEARGEGRVWTAFVCPVCKDGPNLGPVSGREWSCSRGHEVVDAVEVEVVPKARLDAALRLVERFAPHKHDTGCLMHTMHDDLYENPEPSDNPPQPRKCDCGYDEARAALTTTEQAVTGQRVSQDQITHEGCIGQDEAIRFVCSNCGLERECAVTNGMMEIAPIHDWRMMPRPILCSECAAGQDEGGTDG